MQMEPMSSFECMRIELKNRPRIKITRVCIEANAMLTSNLLRIEI